MKLLFLGDIVGKGGRNAVKACLPQLRDKHLFDFCVVNAENIAGGNGMTASCLQDLRTAGVDVCTGGDHTWDQKDFVNEIVTLDYVLRPANLPAAQPGRGYGVFTTANGQKVGVVSLLGRTFLNNAADNPFLTAEQIVAELRQETNIILVDFHAEATSEKIALARYLDGKVTAVLGTHTHVPTADEQIFPGGTAFQCDVGMVGSRESVLGREIGPIVSRFVTGMPTKFTVAEEHISLNGALVTADDDGHALSIERIHCDLP